MGTNVRIGFEDCPICGNKKCCYRRIRDGRLICYAPKCKQREGNARNWAGKARVARAQEKPAEKTPLATA